jgi:hypothetical protein
LKHRAGSSKIKYEHTMIHGLREFLEKELEPLDYVEAIFPGEIRRTKGISSKFNVRFKYATKTGVKLLAYAPSVVQEVFVVTKDPEALKRFIEGREDS